MTVKFKFYSDPGHGWAAVKRKTLADLGILNQISGYSYQRGGTVYLEEDCDLSVLFAALRARGVQPQLEERRTDRNHPIRGYDRFHI